MRALATLGAALVADGFGVDFGYDDQLAGRAAPAEVFPRIAS